jgi:hypothetical protein
LGLAGPVAFGATPPSGAACRLDRKASSDLVFRALRADRVDAHDKGLVVALWAYERKEISSMMS